MIDEHGTRLHRIFAIAFGLALALKAIAAWNLNLFGDEAFYWQCAQRPAWGYTDLPFGAAMTVKAGTALWGDTVWGVRWWFFLAGALVPLVIVWFTRPMYGPRAAWLAGLLACAVPGLMLMGTVAIPDALVLLFTAVFWLAMERALRLTSPAWWAVVGAVTALGFMTHYRFVTAPAACILILLWPNYRAHLRTIGPWLAGGIAALGLIPAAIVNLRTGFEPLSYFLGGRHGDGADWGNLAKHIAEQMALVSPPLYIVLIAVLVGLIRTILRAGQPSEPSKASDHARFLVPAALIPITLYFFASALHDSGPLTVHWPLVGYIPLLPAAGNWLANVLERGGKTKRWLASGSLAFGYGLLTIILIELALGWFGIPGVRKPFAAWDVMAKAVEERLPDLPTPDGEKPIIIADHYKAGANLEFIFQGQISVFILDHSKNYMHGRQRQFDRWDIGEKGLWQQHGRHALLLIDRKEVPLGHEQRWMDHIKEFFHQLDEKGTDIAPIPGEPDEPKHIDLYQGQLREKWF